MGLIKALSGAIGGTMADQWLEFFYCESIPANILVTKGQKQVNGKRSSNTKGNDNIISNGSGIAVADGQCMIIVEQGRVMDICSEPGEYTYDKGSEPSVFAGNLGDRTIGVIKTMHRRFKFGGDTGKDQRVYYFNMKEILDNKFGTANPIPFRVCDTKIGLDLDTAVRCFGVFSYRIKNPMVFYQNVCGNVTDNYPRSNLDNMLRTEFISALQPAFGKLSDLGMRPNQIVNHTTELEEAMNSALDEKWYEKRGLEIVTIAIGSLTLPPEDAEMIKKAQQTAMLRDPGMAGATLVNAQADALRAAASNENGAMAGLMGVGMVGGMSNMTGMNAQNFYNMQGQQQAQQQQFQQQQQAQQPAPAAAAGAASSDEWKCVCGSTAHGKFCTECGAKKPEASAGWKCACGAVNKGKFCPECGAKKPEAEPLYRCDKCGWEPKDPKHPPKFCPECGDPFNDKDEV